MQKGFPHTGIKGSHASGFRNGSKHRWWRWTGCLTGHLMIGLIMRILVTRIYTRILQGSFQGFFQGSKQSIPWRAIEYVKLVDLNNFYYLKKNRWVEQKELNGMYVSEENTCVVGSLRRGNPLWLLKVKSLKPMGWGYCHFLGSVECPPMHPAANFPCTRRWL